MQGDEIGARQQRVQFHLLHAHRHRALGREVGIERDHLHAHANRLADDDGADVACTDDAERLGLKLDAHEAVLLPLAGMGGRVCRRNLAGQRKHQRNRMLGRGDRVAEGRVHHDDATRGRGRNIDVVDADAGAADDLEVRGAFQELRRGLGGRADGKAVIVADHGGKLVLVLAEIGIEGHVDAAILEDLHGGGRQGVGNQNAGLGSGHGSVSRKRGGGANGIWQLAIGEKGDTNDRSEARSDCRLSNPDCRLFQSVARVVAKAYSIHGISAFTSRACTVAPHQMRRPGGASR